MNVAHLSTWDKSGGAARAAYRLHQGLRAAGEDSRMLVQNKSGDDPSVETYTPTRTLFGRLIDRIRRRWRHRRFQEYTASRPEGLESFSQAWTIDGARVAGALPGADVYNLHWISRFIDPLPFFDATDGPVVWTLHDMNPFTGGCHYNVDCRKFERKCGACPQLGSDTGNDLSRSVWSRKRDAYRSALERDRLHIVAPSGWLAQEAQASLLFSDAPVHVIPYGLDPTTFRPRDTEGMRSALEIPKKHRIVLFVADSTTNQRKGFDLLADAIDSLEADIVTLISIGSNAPELDTSLSHRHLGMLTSDVLLAVFYSLADLFVISSRQDNLPNTVLEAMACGTPVVGFDTGGIPDMVRPGETGWLAETGNVRALREAIEHALDDDRARERMGKTCREVVEDEYTLERQAQQYRALYEDLLHANEEA